MGSMGQPQGVAVMQAQPPQLQQLPLQPPLSQPQPQQQFWAGGGQPPMQMQMQMQGMQGMQGPLQAAPLPMSSQQHCNTLLQPPLQQYQYQQQPHMLVRQQQQQIDIMPGYTVMSTLQGPSSGRALQDAASGGDVLGTVAGMQPASVMQPQGMTVVPGSSAPHAQHILWQQQQQPAQYAMAPLQAQQVQGGALLAAPPASMPACPLWQSAPPDLSQLSLSRPAQQQAAGLSAASMQAQLSLSPAASYAAVPAGSQAVAMGPWLN
jgi:hypothetical protein